MGLQKYPLDSQKCPILLASCEYSDDDDDDYDDDNDDDDYGGGGKNNDDDRYMNYI